MIITIVFIIIIIILVVVIGFACASEITRNVIGRCLNKLNFNSSRKNHLPKNNRQSSLDGLTNLPEILLNHTAAAIHIVSGRKSEISGRS